MKQIVSVLLLALLISVMGASGAEAYVSRGDDCSRCHNFSNRPPVANAGADQTVNSGASVTLNGSASSDPDDGIATYAWTQTAGPNVTITNSSRASATFTAPGVSTQTTLTFRLSVSDGFNSPSTDTCTVTVRASSVNAPPVARAGSDQTVAPGAQVTLNGSTSTDSDDGIASYAWTQLSGASVTIRNATSASASFTAPSVQGALSFELAVTDRAGQVSRDTVNVTVSASGGGGESSNLPPTADAGIDLLVLPGAYVNLDGFYSTDPDDAIVSYSWEQTGGPDSALSDPLAMAPIFQVPLSPATLTFTLIVTDGAGNTDSDTVTVIVLSPDGGTPPPPTSDNQAPVANAGRDQTVRSGARVSLSGSGSSDPDGAIASYQWRQTSGPSVTLSGASSASASFRAPSVGSRGATLVFELTVKDRDGLSSSDTVSVRVYRSGSSDEEDDEEDDDDD